MLKKIRSVRRYIKLLLRNIFESILYRTMSSKGDISPIRKIVFVCKGNICRSAFAEFLMRSQTQNTPLLIDSCGLHADIRRPAPSEVIKMATNFGLNLDHHLSKGWKQCDLEDADLIVAMEFWQYRMLVGLFPHKKANIKLLREFASFPENIFYNIDDPFGQDEKIFEKCFAIIGRSISNINTKLIEKSYNDKLTNGDARKPNSINDDYLQRTS